MEANGNGRTALEALWVLLFHPLGHYIVAIVTWLIAFAFAAGMLKQEVRALRADMTRLEEKVDQVLKRSPIFIPAPHE